MSKSLENLVNQLNKRFDTLAADIEHIKRNQMQLNQRLDTIEQLLANRHRFDQKHFTRRFDSLTND